MKIGLYSPFLDNLGGGERYILTAAECLSNNHQVDLIIKKEWWPNRRQMVERFRQIFNLDLAKVNFIQGPFNGENFLRRFIFSGHYDVFIYLTDGSFFISGAKKNILHIQIPFLLKLGWFSRIKLKNWHLKVCNSLFTKKWIEKNWHINCDFVHYGCFDERLIKRLAKKNLILSVGRFFQPLHQKNQELMINTFKQLVDSGLRDWRFIIAGTIKGEQRQKLNELRERIKRYPIKILTNVSFADLVRLYGQAKIYWHAAGYGEDEEIHPERVEHLGLSTGEAMAAGAVPVVINKGGQPELVQDNINGFLWKEIGEWKKKTLKVINDGYLWQKLSRQAEQSSLQFSKAKFCEKLSEIITG